jgi:hypothetical protein
LVVDFGGQPWRGLRVFDGGGRGEGFAVDDLARQVRKMVLRKQAGAAMPPCPCRLEQSEPLSVDRAAEGFGQE